MDQDKENVSNVPPTAPFPEQPPPYVDLPPSSQPIFQPPPPEYGPTTMQQFPPPVYPSSQPPPQVQPGYPMQQFPYGALPPSQPVYPGGPPPPQVQPGYRSNVTVVSSQPVITPGQYLQVKPANHIVLSVITMIFCCWLFGLIALLAALQVDSAWNSGDRLRAQQRSTSAKGWSMAGIVFGIVAYIVIVVSIVIRVVLVTNSNT